MNGKEKCGILKQIRCQVARSCGIEYNPTECTHQGDCRGTCPKCEAELKYITSELNKIKNAGKQVAVAGIAAAVIATSAGGCARKPEPEDDPIVMSSAAADESEAKTPEQKPGQKPEQKPEQPIDTEKTEISDDIEINNDVNTGDDIEINDETSEYIELDGDVVVDYVTEGDIGFVTEGVIVPDPFIDNENCDTETNEVGDCFGGVEEPELEIPTLQQAVEMSSKEVASYVVGQNRNAVKVVWSAQAAPIPQPSTNVLENYDEYWVGNTGIHIYFDSNNVITDVKVFIPADCLSDGTVIPETIK